MNFKILIIIGVAVLFVIISFILFLTLSNKRKSKQLQENLKKYKQENKDEVDNSISISKDDVGINLSEEEIMNDLSFDESKTEEEDLDDIDDLDFNIEDFMPNFDVNSKNKAKTSNSPLNSGGYSPNKKAAQNRDDDFEKFLDEHSFTRRVLDKSLLSQIQKLPPEIKAVIMSNVFDKFNDDK